MATSMKRQKNELNEFFVALNDDVTENKSTDWQGGRIGRIWLTKILHLSTTINESCDSSVRDLMDEFQ
jgi:hypothetical protein